MIMALGSEADQAGVTFYDFFTPSLSAGDWTIEVEHTLDFNPRITYGASQNFKVCGPRFSIDSNLILNLYPPAGSTGQYCDVLPNIVFKDAMLPWERTILAETVEDQSLPVPWMALLVFREGELLGGLDSPTRTQSGDVGDLKCETGDPKPQKESDGEITQEPCAFIQVRPDLLADLLPKVTELPFLAHCRRSSMADKAEQGLDSSALTSFVVANRLPSTEGRYFAHLVSLEGLGVNLNPESLRTSKAEAVELVSLASWSFNSLKDTQQDFGNLMDNLQHQHDLWLRLPMSETSGAENGSAQQEVRERIAAGYVPLPYRLRTGEETFAWYRGPCVPLLPDSSDLGTFSTADSALIYDSRFGVFDASLATAWQAGRSLALADRAFGQAMYSYRQAHHRFNDRLLNQLNSVAFDAEEIGELDPQASVERQFLKGLRGNALTRISSGLSDPTAEPSTGYTRRAPRHDQRTLQAAVHSFRAHPHVHALVCKASEKERDAVVPWLAEMRLLRSVPFNLLVPDSRMLAPETLRFFFLDSTWIGAMLDGACSIGTQSSRDLLLNLSPSALLHQSAATAARTSRAARLGLELQTPSTESTVITGFLLRSAAVSGWPNLGVSAWKSVDHKTAVRTLRQDLLAPDVMICLFDGVPDCVEFAQPEESIRLGIKENGTLPRLETVTVCFRDMVGNLSHSKVLDVENTRERICAALNITPLRPSKLATLMMDAPVLASFSTSNPQLELQP